LTQVVVRRHIGVERDQSAIEPPLAGPLSD
jgi:hypothetical protein